MAELDRAIELAHEKGQPAAAIAGVLVKAKMLGLDSPKEDEGARRFENMTEAEKRFLWANLLADVRAIKAANEGARPKMIESN